MKHQKGFSMAEILIVIVIIGVLSAIALPRFFPQKEKARSAEAIQRLSAMRQGEIAYSLENLGQFIALDSTINTTVEEDKWGQIGLDQPQSTDFFKYEAYNTNGTVKATRQGGRYGNKTIILDRSGTFTGTHPFKPKGT